MPRSSAGFRLSFYPWVIIVLTLAWTLLTVYALSVTTKNIDYGVTKADNKILKTKLALIAEEITRNRRYIKLARDTDNQITIFNEVLQRLNKDIVVRDIVGNCH